MCLKYSVVFNSNSCCMELNRPNARVNRRTVAPMSLKTSSRGACLVHCEANCLLLFKMLPVLFKEGMIDFIYGLWLESELFLLE
jgi:hypothetical protein